MEAPKTPKVEAFSSEETTSRSEATEGSAERSSSRAEDESVRDEPGTAYAHRLQDYESSTDDDDYIQLSRETSAFIPNLLHLSDEEFCKEVNDYFREKGERDYDLNPDNFTQFLDDVYWVLDRRVNGCDNDMTCYLLLLETLRRKAGITHEQLKK